MEKIIPGENEFKWMTLVNLAQSTASYPKIRLLSSYRRLVVMRLFTSNLLIFFLQYCGLLFSTYTYKPLPFSLATGTACAFIFMRGYCILPGIFLGTATTYFLVYHSLLNAGIAGVISVAEVSLLFWITQYTLYPTLLFYRFTILLKFLGLSGIITALSQFLLLKLNPPYLFVSAKFIYEWLADLNGIFLLSVGLIIFDTYFPLLTTSYKKIQGLLLKLFLGLIFFLILSFFIPTKLYFFIFNSALFITTLWTSRMDNLLRYIFINLSFGLLIILLIKLNSAFFYEYSKFYYFFQFILLSNYFLGLALSFKKHIYSNNPISS